jgi:hypothetical protein
LQWLFFAFLLVSTSLSSDSNDSENHMNLTTDKPIKRFVFGLHENESGLEVIAVVFNDESNEKIPLTVENLTWSAELVKTQGVKVNSLNRLNLACQKLWDELLHSKESNQFLDRLIEQAQQEIQQKNQ